MQSGLGDAEIILREKWDDGHRLVFGVVRRLQLIWGRKEGWALLVCETLVFPQLFPRVKAQRSKV